MAQTKSLSTYYSPAMPEDISPLEKLGYVLLSDADLAVSKQLGIAYRASGQYATILPKSSSGKNNDLLLPVPAVFILDKKGVIRFEYINPDFKQRISASLLLAAAGALYEELVSAH
ncbi:hypothetical protein KTO58_14080 [Chitinophaga pendula]|uniref:hypothetical protein n=1 Tax=Chitinophaga TaxID=79328 RepID=UPI0012FE338E|nr:MULTISPECIES: hypothetical protein [Chitinophaga]UCJ04832.1 hypothetical protein KTO58_14080 [Chitinophaga pendula]